MRVGQRPQLVPIVFDWLMIGCLPDLDSQKIFWNGPPVHHDIGMNGLAERIIGRDDRSPGQEQRALAQPVVVAVDLPVRELPLDANREPMAQRALAGVLLKQIGLASIELLERCNEFVQLGVHDASDHNATRAY